MTPLSMAAAANNTEMVRLLVDKGANASAVDKVANLTWYLVISFAE